ncbi:MAG: HigA family addiction module antidote protein [Anaerolineae bacterium]|nr:HigA family addiction module antidote protein [Anaerolineae bacterium]
MSPIHPGEILLEDFLNPLNMTTDQLATELHVPVERIGLIIQGQESINADIALRLGRYFGNGAGIWLRLQTQYDLETTEAQIGDQIKREIRTVQAS